MSDTGLSQRLLPFPLPMLLTLTCLLLALPRPQHIPGVYCPNSSLSTTETCPRKLLEAFIENTSDCVMWLQQNRKSSQLHEWNRSPYYCTPPSFLTPASTRAVGTRDTATSTIPRHTRLRAFLPKTPCQDQLSSTRQGPR